MCSGFNFFAKFYGSILREDIWFANNGFIKGVGTKWLVCICNMCLCVGFRNVKNTK